MFMKNSRVFISGHVDLFQKSFEKHYIPFIDQAIANDCTFVIGNSTGCDEMAMSYLLKMGVDKNKITIYHHDDESAQRKEHLTIEEIKNLGFTKIITGFATHDHRDTAMTDNSDCDIAWVRPVSHTIKVMKLLGKIYDPLHESATYKNILRREMYSKRTNQIPVTAQPPRTCS